MNFNDEMKKRVTEIRSIIEKYLPQEEGFQKTLLEAMNYSMLVGGKKLRPLLMRNPHTLLFAMNLRNLPNSLFFPTIHFGLFHFLYPGCHPAIRQADLHDLSGRDLQYGTDPSPVLC